MSSSAELVHFCESTFLKTETSDSRALTDQMKIGGPDICHEIDQLEVTHMSLKVNNVYFIICSVDIPKLCGCSVFMGSI